MSAELTPISLRQSLNSPTQSLNVPIFATLPGIKTSLFCGSGNSGLATRDSRLLRLKHRRPLLHVRRQPFLCVFTLEQQLLVLPFPPQGRFHRNLPPRLHPPLHSSPPPPRPFPPPTLL